MQMDLALAEPVAAEVAWEHGGKRPGAGRKKTGKRRDPRHRPRHRISRHHAQHVTLRVRPELGRLRKRNIYRAVRKAIERTLMRHDFRVCQLSIQHNHLHFIIEAENKVALERGMQGLAISAAKRINAILAKRKGKVFEFRYHATAITNPLQARRALAYVLNNWRRHREDKANSSARMAAVDPYSSALRFDGWSEAELVGLPRGFNPDIFQPMPVARPQTWLLNVGWKRHGEISVYETPGPLDAKVHA